MCRNELKAQNNYIFLEDFTKTTNHFYFPYDVTSKEALKQLFYTSSSECYVSSTNATYRFWIVEDNNPVKFLAFNDSSMFNHQLVDSLSLKRDLADMSFQHSLKEKITDSLRSSHIPFMMADNLAPDYGYELELNCSFKSGIKLEANEDYERLFFLTDSLKTLFRSTFTDEYLVYLTSASSPDLRNYFALKLYLPTPDFDYKRLKKTGFKLLVEPEIKEREYWIWLVE
jgi:hypothetical protein